MFSLEGGEARTKQEDYNVVDNETQQPLHTVSPLFNGHLPFGNLIPAVSLWNKGKITIAKTGVERIILV